MLTYIRFPAKFEQKQKLLKKGITICKIFSAWGSEVKNKKELRQLFITPEKINSIL